MDSIQGRAPPPPTHPHLATHTPPGTGLHPSFHDDVARFLAAMSPTDGVREALLLPGLTPAAEMALAIRLARGGPGLGGVVAACERLLRDTLSVHE